MTDQERAVRSNVWEVRKACLDHAMSVSANTANADTVVAYAEKLEAYVLRDATMGKLIEATE